MRKRFVTFPLFLLFVVLLTLPASAAGERLEVANRDDTGGAFACDVKLSGGQIRGDIFAVLFAESEQMKQVSRYPAAETVQVALQDVAATDCVKILWTDTNGMPLASPAVLRMSGNQAAAYAQFAQNLRGLQTPKNNAESNEPYALARLLVSADTLPDLTGYDVQTVSGPDHLHILQFKTPGEAERCEKYLKASRAVRYAEPDVIITANGDGAETGTPHSWGVAETGIGAYADSLRTRGLNHAVTVAVIDSGVDSSHPFLKGRLVAGYDFVERDSVPQDGHGHGTHVAGTVVDCTPGMKVNIMPVRVLDNGAGGTLLDIFLGIRYAADNGANVINLSLSLRSHSDMIEEAIRDAISKNITVVVAAGNYNSNAAFYCPAHTPDCITVAAVDSALKRHERSNYGGVVDLAAPGVAVNSSLPGGTYGEMTGTSMATPHVSAAAALLISELGAGQTPSQITAAIRGAAKSIPRDPNDFEWQRYNGNDFLGAGVLDMRAFIPEPENKFYAHLYADGEMVFQTSKTPNPDKTLVETYPLTASAGAGEYAAWYNRRAEIRTVTFADTMRPDSTALWFYGCGNLTEIRGVENLDTSAVKDMSSMFARCASLQTLDLTALNTKNVTNTRQMFFSCAALTTVYASGAFDVSNVQNSDDMFMGCTALVGGSGTKFDSGHTDKSYARIDGGTSAPGYFTDKSKPAPTPEPSTDVYAILYSDGEFVFQKGDTPQSGKTVSKTYKVDVTASKDDYAPWYNERMSVKVVTFADTVKPVSTAYWFFNCENLQRVDNIGNLDTSAVTNMHAMFGNCFALEALDVSGFDTANVTNMTFMFLWCKNLTELDVSGWNTANVTTMHGLFNDCSSLRTLNVSGFNTAKVTDMRGMFGGCFNLTELDVSHFDTANVTNMCEMFWSCYVATLDVSGFNTANVTDMLSMFYGCSKLTTLDLSGFDTAKVKYMERMFYGCSNLKTIYASDKFTTASVTKDSEMFKNCAALVGGSGTKFDDSHIDKAYARIDGGTSAPGYFTDKSKPAPTPEPSTDVYAILYSDGELVFQNGDTPQSGKTVSKTYKVDLDAVYTGYPSDYAPWYKERKSVKIVNFADKISPTATALWFYNCSNLVRVDNIQNLDTANVTSMSGMFAICRGLTALDVSKFDTANVTDMNSMFSGCSGLTALDVSHFDTKNVTSTEGMFSDCSGLTVLDLSKFDTANVTDMNSMFLNCSGLTVLDLSKFDTANVTNMGGMFMDCSGLTALDLSHFDTANVTDMGGMFEGCSRLTTLDLSHFNTANVTIMHSMFHGCSGLTALDVSKFDTANVTNMGGMFMDCSGLTALDVSKFDTANVTNMGGMFMDCSGLTALDVSKFDTANVTDMSWMFEGCSGLKTIYASDKFTITSVKYDSGTFKNCTSLIGGSGTKFDSNHTDKSYARIDGGTSSPGYFTRKA